MSWKIYKFVGVLQAVSVENCPATKANQMPLLISLIILGVETENQSI